MKKLFIMILFFVAVLIPYTAIAGGTKTDTSCQTQNPIVLAHGIAMNDIPGYIEYFNKVADRLRSKGATVYIAQVDKMAATGTKAYQFANYLNTNVLPKHSKVNIIGHSHGGIYTRFAILNQSYTSPKYGTKTWSLPSTRIASLTQIDSPNQGSPVADALLAVDYGTNSALTTLINAAYTLGFGTLFGNEESDVYGDSKANGFDLSIDGAASLYQSMGGNNGIPGVYCQSYTHKMKQLLCLPVPQIGLIQLMALTMPVQCLAETIGYKGGPHQDSDGIVSVKSATWANYRGVDDGGWAQIAGIDHCNATGLPYGITGFFSAPDKFEAIVKDLKAKGL
ncbi:MAG: hypothetical protein HQK79_08140 [Desulfobacterales bacterium]|nr:hypothetical protein [Desulfobacterales bacterium]MBF0398508.1 hypothetical protein [Desulfobacterales bacterium]